MASIKMPIGENWTVSRCRYASEDGKGKRVCLATGIHGDERMGQLVAYDVAQRIKAQPEHLHGTIDIYPMLNAIGLQNPGIDVFCERDIPFLKQYDTKIIVNVCGHAPEEYYAVVERLANEPIDMMEINISCPNVNAGFLAFGQDPKQVEKLTAEIKKRAKQPVIMKLTPNVTDITEIAKAAEAGGADAVSLINTLTGMKIDVNRRTFAIANKTAGVSGPAIHPIAVRMVYQVANAINLPIIGMGGIASAEDAIEMILAGASAVAVGTANFYNPAITMEIVDGIEAYMKKHGFNSID